MKHLLFFTVLFLVFTRSFGQTADQPIVDRLNNAIRPIQTLHADSAFGDLAFLKPRLQDKEIIALGEVTHGTAEVFAYKDRLVRFLVSELGYKAIAFESDAVAMEKIDHYICRHTDSLVFAYGTALLGTNRSMIEWLRSYNGNLPETKRVHVYGLEARNLSNILRKIANELPALTATEREVMESIAAKEYARVDKTDRSQLHALIGRLKALQLSEVNRQSVSLLDQTLRYTGKNNGYRDAYMAANASWLKQRADRQKLILWAHNGHVARSALYGHPPLGAHLTKEFGKKYLVIGTDFNKGSAYVNVYVARNRPLKGFQAYPYPEVTSPGAYEFYFKQCKFKQFILDVETASQDRALADFLVAPREMRMIGALHIPVNKRLSLAENFDILVYFDTANSTFR